MFNFLLFLPRCGVLVFLLMLHLVDVVLHLDNDKTGRLCTAALTELLKKDYEIVDSPPPVGKDVNDFLMSYLGLSRQKPVRERSGVR